MRNWPAGLISLVNSDPVEILWAELYTITMATPTYRDVFDQFALGAISSFWTANAGTFGTVQGKAAADVLTNNGSGRAAMHWNRNAFLDNQWSQAMIVTPPTISHEIGVAVRMATSAETMYAFRLGATSASIYKIVAGTSTLLATASHAAAAGDIMRLAAYGTLLQASINGNVFVSAVDAAISSGSAGTAALGTSGAGSVTNWVGGSIGQQYLWTNWDNPVTLNGRTWQPTGTSPNGVPLIQRSRLSFTKGTEVGEMEISWADNGSCQINGVALMTALAQKQFDGATIDLSLAASIPGGSFQGPGTYFFGRVSDVNPGRTLCKITVKDKREEMNQNLPRKVIQQACGWTLFDAGCTLNSANFAVNGTVSAGSNLSTLQTNLTQPGPVAGPTAACSLSSTGGHAIPAQTYYQRATYITALGETIGGPEAILSLSANELLVAASPAAATGALFWNCYVSTVSGGEQLQNDAPIAIGTSFTMPDYQQSPSVGLPVPTINQTGYFDLGYIVWTSGANTGTVSAIKSYLAGGIVNFFKPLLNLPHTGDTFTAYPGCDKQIATCDHKFSNLSNFEGMSFIPSPETTV